MRIRTVARPHLQRLCQTTGQTIYLATLFEGDELYLDQVEPEGAATNTNWIGRTIPAHTASSGKALLAYLPDDEIAAYLERGLVAATRNTITDPDALRSHLAVVRERGYATSQDEYLVGFSNIAAPIFDRTRKNVAVVALSGPTVQLSAEHLQELAPLVVATANAISVELGFNLNGQGKYHGSRNSSTYRLTHH
jgi:DNA-binding IclR family transcriptional regulator